MKVVFINTPYNGEINLREETFKILGKYNTLALYSSAQFLEKLPQVVKQLKTRGIKTVTSKPARTSAEFQILGCDVYPENLNLKSAFDAFLYIGDGRFHPKALLFASNGEKPVVCFNPISGETAILTQADLESAQKKRRARLSKFLMSDNIGILVTTKPGQMHMYYSGKLAGKFPEKNFYTFIADNISFSELENFPFIDVWVNTACPRIGLEDTAEFRKPIINAEEVLNIESN